METVINYKMDLGVMTIKLFIVITQKKKTRVKDPSSFPKITGNIS